MPKTALRIDKLHKSYGPTHAVNNLSLELKPGEIYALIGPNGAGKTTTVKIITGLISPDRGTVHVADHSIETDSIEAKRQLGYIPDNPFVYPYLSGREFLELSGDLFEIPRTQTEKRIKMLLNEFQIEDIIDGLFSDFSRGNQQKTAIISALLHDPQVLIVDEPIVGLDVQSQQSVSKLFKEFTKNGGSILLCTHTLSWAQNNANRIGILNKGKLLTEGTLAQLRAGSKKKSASLEDLYLHFTTV